MRYRLKDYWELLNAAPHDLNDRTRSEGDKNMENLHIDNLRLTSHQIGGLQKYSLPLYSCKSCQRKEKRGGQREKEKPKKNHHDLNKRTSVSTMSDLLLWIMIVSHHIYSSKVDSLPCCNTNKVRHFHNVAQILIPRRELILCQKLVSEKDWALHDFEMNAKLGQSSCFHKYQGSSHKYCYYLRRSVWHMESNYHYSVAERTLRWKTHCCLHCQS